MMQTEAQRQYYLGVAGIRLWYAREPLPGAAPSPEFQFPEADELGQRAALDENPAVVGQPAKSNAGVTSSEASQRGAQRMASLQALMEDKKEPAPSVESKQVPQSADTDVPPESSENDVTSLPGTLGRTSQAFGLSMGVFSGERHILIAHTSKEASLRLQETLATNIMRSLGEAWSGEAQWVHWPVFNNRLVPGSTLADLRSVITQVLGNASNKAVVVLGRLEGAEAGSGWLAEVLKRAPDVEFEHSLTELAGNPSLKRSLWQQLKPLVSA